MRLPWRKKRPELVEEVKRLRLDPEDVLVVVGARILRDDDERALNPFEGVIPNRVVMFEEPDVDLVVLAREVLLASAKSPDGASDFLNSRRTRTRLMSGPSPA